MKSSIVSSLLLIIAVVTMATITVNAAPNWLEKLTDTTFFDPIQETLPRTKVSQNKIRVENPNSKAFQNLRKSMEMSLRTIKKESCCTMKFTTKYGNYSVPMNKKCEHNDVVDGTIEIDFTKTDAENQLAWDTNPNIVSTDNYSYIAGTDCILDSEKFHVLIIGQDNLEEGATFILQEVDDSVQ